MIHQGGAPEHNASGKNRRGRDASLDIPQMPPNLKRNTTVEIESACDRLQSKYAEFIDNLDEMGAFGAMNLKYVHHYKQYGMEHDAEISGETMKTIIKEVTKTLPGQLEVHSRGSMFVRYDEDSPNYLRACLTGIEGTPYSSGIFIFDIYIPAEYPHVPCMATHVTPNADLVHANNGPGGFSPNLHSDSGQVCLSLLGTWEGRGWDPETSNIYQVLSSILWMILGAQHPYYMEPDFGGWEGTAPATLDQDPGIHIQMECELLYVQALSLVCKYILILY
jgi:ubiquitin-protein ligase